MNRSKAKGTRAESRVVKFLEGYGFSARRKALAGSNDLGDVELFAAPGLVDPVSIEVKAGKQTANPSRSQLEEWLRQAKVEAGNSGSSFAVLVVVRYNRKLKDADVWTQYIDGDGYEVRAHSFLDEWCEEYLE